MQLWMNLFPSVSALELALLVNFTIMMVTQWIFIGRDAKGERIRMLEIYLLTAPAYLVDSALAVGAFWVIGLLPLWRELRKGPQDFKRATFLLHHMTSILFLCLGLSILWWEGQGNLRAAPFEASQVKLAVTLLTLVALIRQGLFPFHLWVKACADVRPFPVKMPFYMGNMGLLLFGKYILPIIGQEYSYTFGGITAYAVISALYLANLAFVQEKVRLSMLYVMISQFSILFAVLEINSAAARVGAVYHFMAVGCIFSAIFAMLTLIENRTGPLRSNVFYGLVRANPTMATPFLLFCLLGMALPFTMAFVGEDILFHAIIQHYPLLGIGVLASAAFNGINLYRIQAGMFGGENQDYAHAKVAFKSRHRLTLAVLALFVVCMGLWPRPLLHGLMKIM